MNFVSFHFILLHLPYNFTAEERRNHTHTYHKQKKVKTFTKYTFMSAGNGGLGRERNIGMVGWGMDGGHGGKVGCIEDNLGLWDIMGWLGFHDSVFEFSCSISLTVCI